MTVKELIVELSACDPDALVVLQKDAEGNGYSPCRGADPACVYVPENTWSGDVYPTEVGDGITDEDLYSGDDGVKAVVLHPIN